MKQFSNYKRRKIAHFYRDTNSIGDTVKKFNITYKELYRIIKTSRILSFRKIDGELLKICNSCKNLKPYTEEFFYKRKGTKYLYTSCKRCMGLLSRTYKIINRDKIKDKRNESSRKYYNNNKTIIITKKKIFYNKNKSRILQTKKYFYIRDKKRFLRSLRKFIL